MPGQDIVKEAIRASWTMDRIAGVVVVILSIMLVSMVVSQNAHVKRLISNFQKTNDTLLKTNNDIAENNQKQMQALTTAVNKLSTETRNDIEKLGDKIEDIERKVDDIGKRDQKSTN